MKTWAQKQTKNAWHRNMRAQRIKEGLCAECGKNPLAERSTRFCNGCLNDIEKAVAKRRQRRIAAGICIDCPLPTKPGCIRCSYHLKKARKATKRTIAKYFVAGRCLLCGKACAETSKKMCEYHLIRARKKNQKAYQRRKRHSITSLAAVLPA